MSRTILDALESVPGLRIHGLTDRNRLNERVPTLSFTMPGRAPRQIAAALGKQGIFATCAVNPKH